MAEKHVVLISRKWHEPDIRVDVTRESIGVSMPLSDFLTALITEAGNPALLLTQTQLAQRLTAAAERVVTGMKAETTRVM